MRGKERGELSGRIASLRYRNYLELREELRDTYIIYNR